MYTITLTTKFAINANDFGSKVFKHLYENGRSLAIFTAKQLPALGEISLYVTLGQVRVKINRHPIQVTLNDPKELDELRKFHGMMFRDLLKTTSDFLVYDYSNNENSYFIVPIIDNNIDWNVVRKFQKLSKVTTPTKEQRAQRQFKSDDVLYKVVTAWYRQDIDQR